MNSIRHKGKSGALILLLFSTQVLAGLYSPLTAAMVGSGVTAILTGVGAPVALAFNAAALTSRGIASAQAYKWSQIYNGIHYDSYR